MALFSICKTPSHLALKIKSKTKAHTSAPFRGSQLKLFVFLKNPIMAHRKWNF